ncbi:MAG: zinc-ribbon domain-containing protein [Deltaproteobacteria bacterium]|nr:zinc-ribbon domain-containing protein [Deltaproteobacteria bacterium]
MLVTCEQCHTTFRLDESLITREVVKVRCSRCQHVFTVARPAGGAGASAEVETEPPGGEPEARMPPAEPGADETGGPSESEPSLPAAPGEPRSTLRAVAVAVLAGCLLGLLLALLSLWYFGSKQPAPPGPATAGSLAPPLPPVSPAELRHLVIDLKDARYQGLVNVKGGQLLVIEGVVKNLTGEARGPIRLKVTLTDALNRPVRELLFYSGTTLSEEELRNLNPEEIKRWLATPGGRDGTRVLKPGESQPFTAVLFGVPDNLAEARYGFNLVVVEGPQAPGK